LASSIRDLVFDLPIVDTHAHIRQWKDMPQPVTGYTFFNLSGCLRAIFAVAGALSREEYREGKQFEDWPSLSRAIDEIKATAYYRILLKGLKSLYHLDFDELDEESFAALGRKLTEAYRRRGWYRTVLREKAGFAIDCQDSCGAMDRSLFTPITRFDGYVLFGEPGWRRGIVEEYGEERTSNLESLLECLRQDFERALHDGTAAIKGNYCWGRTLKFQPVERAAAENALALCLQESPNGKDCNDLGDFVVDQIAKLCAEHDIPLQIHTGPAMGMDHVVDYGNPLHLNSLILRNSETRFVILHAGGPFIGECAALATQFPNVYLDLCGVLGWESLRAILDNWVEYVPHRKLMWGTDVHLVEEAYAISRHFRGLLSEFLESRVGSGYFSQATAEDFARGILGDNARRILRIPGG